MTQDISCFLEDENGKIILDSGLNFVPIKEYLWKIDKLKKQYNWLHTIDEYWDTVFNKIQAPIVISELKKLINNSDKNLQNLIVNFIKFISKISTHKYIKFYWD